MKYLLVLLILTFISASGADVWAAERNTNIALQPTAEKYKVLNTLYSPLANYKQSVFFDWINTKAFMRRVDSSEERKLARKAWKKGLGVDVFYPYFELKKAKNIIEDKTEVRLFKMKGKARIEQDEIKYIFRARF